MARNDFKVYDPIEPKYSVDFVVALGTATSIKTGEPTASDSYGGTRIMIDAEGTTGTRFTGIAKSDSTDTASAAGSVTVWLPLPGMVYSGAAKSSAAADTQAEINALQGKRVIFDLTSTAWTIDTAASDGATNCVVIIGGDYRTSRVYFTYSISGTILE
jgi:hypothetical protein